MSPNIVVGAATGTAVQVATGEPGAPGPAVAIETAAPVDTNDNTEGYVVGQMWLNTASGYLYCATSVATGAAVWQEIGGPFLPLAGGTMEGPLVTDGTQPSFRGLINPTSLTLANTDENIAILHASQAINAQLPAAGTSPNQYWVQDFAGTAASWPVTFVPNGSDLINGQNANLQGLNTNFGIAIVRPGGALGGWIITQIGPNASGSLNSPAFTGTPTAPTASLATATTQIATTAFARSTATSVQTISTQLTLNAAQASGIFYYLTASGGNQTVELPTHAAGQNVCIMNVGSTNNIVVEDSTATTIITLAPGMSVFLNDDGTVWRVH